MAGLIGADSADVAPVVNATAAINTVVASAQLRTGDLLLVTSITYPAVRLFHLHIQPMLRNDPPLAFQLASASPDEFTWEMVADRAFMQ